MPPHGEGHSHIPYAREEGRYREGRKERRKRRGRWRDRALKVQREENDYIRIDRANLIHLVMIISLLPFTLAFGLFSIDPLSKLWATGMSLLACCQEVLPEHQFLQWEQIPSMLVNGSL